MRKFLAVGAVLAAVLAPCVAEAAAVTYRFSAASFSGQGNVAGTFVYDTASSQVTAANITYDAGQYVNGDAAPAATYAHLDQPVSPPLRVVVDKSPGPRTGQIAGLFLIVPNQALDAFNVSFVEARCGNEDCSSTLNLRLSRSTIATSVVSAVPTLSEWAMIAMGLALAGGAAVYIQRRRWSV